MPELINQPRGTNLCGQACVATIAKISLDEAIEKAFNGYKGKTKTRHIIKALKSLGLKPDERLTIIPPSSRGGWCSGVCSIAWYWDKTKKIGHWMVLDHGILLDPAGRHTGKRLIHPDIEPYVKSTLYPGWR